MLSKVGPDLEWANIVNNAQSNMKESGEESKKQDSQKQDELEDDNQKAKL